MADICAEYTVNGMTMNEATGDTLVTKTVDGLDGVNLRRTIPPQGQQDGSIFLQAKKAHRIATFTGFTLIRTADWEDLAAYLAAQDALHQAWIAALDAIENTVDALTWGSSSLAVYKSAGPVFSPGDDGTAFGMRFTLSLYAPNPTIS